MMRFIFYALLTLIASSAVIGVPAGLTLGFALALIGWFILWIADVDKHSTGGVIPSAIASPISDELEPLPEYDYTVSGYARYVAQDEERRGNTDAAQLWRITSWRTWTGSNLRVDPRSGAYDSLWWPGNSDKAAEVAITEHVKTLESVERKG